MEVVKEWIEEHRKVVVVVVLCIALLLVAPFAINFIGSISSNQEENNDVQNVDLSSEQNKLVEGYTSSEKDIISILENSK